MKARVNIDRFKAKMARIALKTPTAREAFVLALASDFATEVIKATPKDTNRLARGWAGAASALGLSVGNVPPIQASRHREKLMVVLVDQVEKLRKRLGWLLQREDWWYTSQPNRKKQGYYHKLQREIQKAETRLKKAVDDLEVYAGTEASIVMMRGSGAALNGYQRQLDGKKLNATIREKVYGGRGRIIRGNTTTGVVMSNMEPHVRVVEKFKGPVARAKRILYAGKLKPLRRKYVKMIAEGATASMSARGVSR